MHYNYTQITPEHLLFWMRRVECSIFKLNFQLLSLLSAQFGLKGFSCSKAPVVSHLFCMRKMRLEWIWHYLFIRPLFSFIQLQTTELSIIKLKVTAWGEAGNYQFVLHFRAWTECGKTAFTSCCWKQWRHNLWSSVSIQKHYDDWHQCKQNDWH